MAGRVDLTSTRTSPQRSQRKHQQQQQQHQNQALHQRDLSPDDTDKLPLTARAASSDNAELNKYAELLKKQMAPLKLKDAEDSGDTEALTEAIKALKEHEHLKDEHDRAVIRLDQIHSYRKELMQACDQGNRKTILELLQYGAKMDMNKFCRHEIKHAQKVADELGVKSLPMPGMLAMDRKTMTEIKSYSKPSPLVHMVMQAVFLLFDEDEEKTSRWSYCQALCTPDGQNGFLRKMMKFQPDSVDPFIVNRVGELIQDIELREILKASPGAATFYVWLRSMLKLPDNVAETPSMSSPTTGRRRPPRAARDSALQVKRMKAIEREKEIFKQRQMLRSTYDEVEGLTARAGRR